MDEGGEAIARQRGLLHDLVMRQRLVRHPGRVVRHQRHPQHLHAHVARRDDFGRG